MRDTAIVRSWLLLFTVSAMFLMGFPLVGAQSNGEEGSTESPNVPTFAISPAGEAEGAYFTATMEPGTRNTFTASLFNGGDIPFRGRTFIADAYTIVNGGMGVREDGSAPTGVTTWIDYPAEMLTLDPNSVVERGVTVSVPDDTPPGQYIAGIVLQTDGPIPIEGTTTFLQVIRKTVAVFITVPGRTEAGFEVGAVFFAEGGAASAMVVEIANVGDVLVRPEGTVVVRDADGATVLTVPANMGPVFAGHSTTLEVVIQRTLPVGEYAVDIRLSDTSSNFTVATLVPISIGPASVDTSPPTLAIEAVTVAPTPSVDDIQYLDVAVRVSNNGPELVDAQIVFTVALDGILVEDFLLASSLVLSTGVTPVNQRYIPLGGWQSGEYTFALTIQTIDPDNAVVSVVAQMVISDALLAP